MFEVKYAKWKRNFKENGTLEWNKNLNKTCTQQFHTYFICACMAWGWIYEGMFEKSTLYGRIQMLMTH